MFSELILLIKKAEYHRIKYEVVSSFLQVLAPGLDNDCCQDSKVLNSKNHVALTFSITKVNISATGTHAPMFGYFKQPCLLLSS